MSPVRRTPSRPLAKAAAAAGAAGLIALSVAAPASAHVTVTPTTTAAGAYTVLTFAMGHGCEGSPTTSLAISIPEGINTVSPERNGFYEVTKEMEELDPPVDDGHGGELTERVATVTYTASTPLPEGYRDSFDLSVKLPEEEGQDLIFPAVQKCAEGENPWTQVLAEGQSEDDLDYPAPFFTTTAAEGDGHGHGDEDAEETVADESGDESGDEAAADSGAESSDDTRAAVATDDDGNGLAIAGLVAGVLGIAVAALALLRTRRTA